MDSYIDTVLAEVNRHQEVLRTAKYALADLAEHGGDYKPSVVNGLVDQVKAVLGRYPDCEDCAAHVKAFKGKVRPDTTQAKGEVDVRDTGS